VFNPPPTPFGPIEPALAGPSVSARSAPRLAARTHDTLRIAVVTETYPPELNGVSLTVARLVHHLRGSGHDVEVLRPRQSGETHPKAGERLLPGAGLPFYPGIQFGFPVTRRLTRDWRVRAPDIVHIATEGPLGWSALRAAHAAGIPVTSDFRTRFDRYCTHYGCRWLAPAIDSYLRAFHNRADITFVSTDHLRGELDARGYRRLETVGRGIDTALFTPARRSNALRLTWGAAPADLVVMHVGRLAAEKNLDLAVRAYEAGRARVARARMVWVGDGPERKRLQRRHPQHIFCGALRDEQLATHYASGDLFLFPSLTETFGNVTLEALASGLAIVAFDYAAAAQYGRTGHCAWLAPYGDAESFVAAACMLATSPALLACFRRAAPRAVAAATWPAVLSRFEAHIAALADAAARRAGHAAQ
jgi:glycosyltransferase involved in cell wall biosynthesis